MLVTVFAKKKTTKDGKPFVAYVAKLTKKDGSEITAGVRFREECGAPQLAECPLNIEFDKADANMSTRTYVREDTGEDATAYTLWISGWTRSAEVYADHSLDDFE